jgi:hypothetical protein
VRVFLRRILACRNATHFFIRAAKTSQTDETLCAIGFELVIRFYEDFEGY